MSKHEDGLSLKEYMHEVRRHLSRYCVSLSYVRAEQPSPEHWQYGTGFLLKLQDQTVILTAGHLAREVHDYRERGKLSDFHVRYNRVSGDLTTVRLPVESLTHESLIVAKDCDAALLRVPQDLASDIEKQDDLCFTTDAFMRGATTERHYAIVCGYPVQANIITKNEAFLTREKGHWLQYNQVKLGSLAFQLTLVSRLGEEDAILPVGFNCEVDEHAFRPFLGDIYSNPGSGVTSAVGMSGGPVLAIVVDPENPEMFFQPRLLGMQASQKYIEWQEKIEITRLTAVSSAKLATWIATVI